MTQLAGRVTDPAFDRAVFPLLPGPEARALE